MRTCFSVICMLAVLAGALSESTEETIYKLKGDSLNLNCSSNAIATWYFDDVKVNDNFTSIETVSNKVTSSLSVTSVNSSGKYQCIKPDASEPFKEFNIIIVDIDSDEVPLNSPNSSLGIDLQCRVASPIDFYPITWMRNDKPVENGTKLEILESVDGQTILRVNKPDEKDVGAYVCVVQIKDNNSTVKGEASITLAPNVAKIEKLRSRVEGEKAVIECKVEGYPVPDMTWYKRMDEEGAKDEEIVFDERITVTENSDKVPNAKLVITDLTIKEDKAFYTCIAINYLGQGNTTALLKVKDKNAAVWPFLGLWAEVITLCCIIFIFEKRRNRRMEEEEEVDAVKQELMNGSSENEEKDLRQRNVNNKS